MTLAVMAALTAARFAFNMLNQHRLRAVPGSLRRVQAATRQVWWAAPALALTPFWLVTVARTMAGAEAAVASLVAVIVVVLLVPMVLGTRDDWFRARQAWVESCLPGMLDRARTRLRSLLGAASSTATPAAAG